MKRPPPIPELSAPPRRRRSLSEEERALWESVAKQTRPLRKKSRIAKTSAASATAAPGVASPAAPAKRLPAPPRAPKPDLPPSAPPLAPLGRRERSQLSRGRKEIDARLDLHGMTQMRAHRALFGFLQRAHSGGLTFVLVITARAGAESSAARCAARCRNGLLCLSSVRWWSDLRKRISAMAARARFMCVSGDRRSEPYKNQNGLTIPTRGISVTIQPKIVVFRSSVGTSETVCEPGKVLTACRIRNMQTAQFEIHLE